MAIRWRPCASGSLTRGLLCCGAAAGPVFVTVFLVEGARRADYHYARHPVSALALGPGGWVQASNFAVAGTLMISGSAGLLRAGEEAAGPHLAPVLIGAAGLGLLASGAVATDPVNGYPPGSPERGWPATVGGVAHNLVALPVLAGLPAAALVEAWHSRRNGVRWWAAFSAATAASAAINGALASAGFGGAARLSGRSGLHQRVAIVALLSWTTVAFLRALRRLALTAASQTVSRADADAGVARRLDGTRRRWRSPQRAGGRRSASPG